MMSSRTGLSDLVHDLRTTLEAISEGLVEGLPDRLLDAEPRLAEIAARLAGSRLDPATTTIPREDVLAARAALHRCEQLGATIRTLGEVYAAGGGYDRHGHYPAPETTALLQARG